MRVISGKYRGKRLNSPKNEDVRPTTDKAKESLFNMIQAYVYDSEFLDLFSGSGAIGIEAFSRGAKSVSMVEKNKDSIKLINSNINLIKEAKENILLSNSNVIDFLNNTSKKYDIIFADPPYEYDNINKIIEIVSIRQLLKEDGILIIETDKNFNLEIVENMYVEKEKIYSISKITIIRLK